MSNYTIGLTWDNMSIANKIQDRLIELNLKSKRDNADLVKGGFILGFSDDNESAVILEGFDKKIKWGCIITLPNDKKEIWIIGGSFDGKAQQKARFQKHFTDLVAANKMFDELMKDYEMLKNE